MERLTGESWTVVLEFTVGAHQDVGGMSAAVLLWQDLASLAVASKNMSHYAKVLIGKRCPSAVGLFYHADGTWQILRREVRFEQLTSNHWDAADRLCAVRSCSVQTGMWVPWHRGRGEYAPHEKN